jgi:hypothetical protein
MAYSEALADRIRGCVPAAARVTEMKMFGGLAFLSGGNMGVGVLDERLMVRVPRDLHDETLAEPHVKPMDFTGRPMRGFVYVEPAGIARDEDLRGWVERGIGYAASLPPK